eukprot:11763288-Alexandrium_andersonii.AAC.1
MTRDTPPSSLNPPPPRRTESTSERDAAARPRGWSEEPAMARNAIWRRRGATRPGAGPATTACMEGCP